MELKFEQSDKECCTGTAGLCFVGKAINKNTSLRQDMMKIEKRHGISNMDLARSYIGLLVLGRHHFDAIDDYRYDDWFKESLGIKQMPSSSTLRLRFNEDAKKLIPAIEAALPEVLINLNAPLTPLAESLDPAQHTPLDIDVTPQDNRNTKKEGVSCTYKHFDGYAPIIAYIGQEGWCMGLELRPGSQHSQNDFIPFLNTVIHRARRFTQNCLLLRLDSAHDAEDTRKEVAHHKNIDHIIKLNPRKEHTITRWLPEFEARGVKWQGLRPGKEYATLSVINETEYGKQRLIIRIIKRTTDSVGQMFLTPDYELDGWWTTLSEDNYKDDHVILLYEDHATSEQFHSEFKTDMDLERPPSGKFDTNDLVMCLGALAYNILRYMGQASLLGPESPIRHSASRRRIKTVIQKLIYQTARFIRKGHQSILRFGYHSPALKSFMKLFPEKSLC